MRPASSHSRVVIAAACLLAVFAAPSAEAGNLGCIGGDCRGPGFAVYRSSNPGSAEWSAVCGDWKTDFVVLNDDRWQEREERYRKYCPNGTVVYARSQSISRGLEPDFLAEYNSGRRLHELESALSSVDSRIASNYRAQESIKQELTDIGVKMIATETTAEQRLAMVTRSAELGRHHGQLTTEIQQLERERAVAERSLLEYRATLAAAF